jgi:hypothetical protein
MALHTLGAVVAIAGLEQRVNQPIQALLRSGPKRTRIPGG